MDHTLYTAARGLMNPMAYLYHNRESLPKNEDKEDRDENTEIDKENKYLW